MSLLNERATLSEDMAHFHQQAIFNSAAFDSLVVALYGMGKTWIDLRNALGEHEGSSFAPSRSGVRWRSHPEASLSNFLYARGIEHRRGTRYHEDYEKLSGRAYGFYDLHFKSRSGAWISAEVWGEKPMGHGPEQYAKKRAIKEQFNAKRSDFIGIEFRDCFSDERLTEILHPFIGRIAPFVFDKPMDPLIQSTHWSNADELLVFCKHIADSQPGGIFPTEEWLRKRGKFKTRGGEVYNTVAVYCHTWLGGVRNVRRLLGQPQHSTTEWDRESALAGFRDWWDKYAKSPNAICQLHARGRISMSKDELLYAQRLRAAIQLHVGSIIAACDEIGVKPTRRYTGVKARPPVTRPLLK